MSVHHLPSQSNKKQVRQPWTRFAIGAVLLLVISGVMLGFIIAGKTRKTPPVVQTPSTAPVETTAVQSTLLPRRLDGVMVPVGKEALGTRAVMVENHPDARPLSGLAKANLVIEVPVEGGITRFLLLFDASTTVDEVGPVRSARPYYVDWAKGWRASYFHVGGSPESLDKIRAMDGTFLNIDEMGAGQYFWRDDARYAPHNAYTKSDLMTLAVQKRTVSSTAMLGVWHFQDAASSINRGTASSVKIPYGGSFNVTWKYGVDRGVYVRSQAGKLERDRNGDAVESENVVVIKTDAQVLDDKGRLKLRTTGSGDAAIYRDGNKYLLRWRRSPNELLHFESTDGTEFLFTRGRTWIEVTIDDQVFAGLGK